MNAQVGERIVYGTGERQWLNGSFAPAFLDVIEFGRRVKDHLSCQRPGTHEQFCGCNAQTYNED